MDTHFVNLLYCAVARILDCKIILYSRAGTLLDSRSVFTNKSDVYKRQLLTLFICLFSFHAVGVAAESVTYQGDKKTILVSGKSGIDLFAAEMKNLMTGDVKEKDIFLGNLGNRSVTFYLLAENSDMTPEEKVLSDKLMEEVSITVEVVPATGTRRRCV